MKAISTITNISKNYIKPTNVMVEQTNKQLDNKQDLLVKKFGVNNQIDHLYKPTSEQQKFRTLSNTPISNFSNLNTHKTS